MHLFDIQVFNNSYNKHLGLQNELVVAGHLSTRYSRQQAERMVRKKLPDLMGNRLYLWG